MEEIKLNAKLEVDDERFIENNEEAECAGKGPDEPEESDSDGNE